MANAGSMKSDSLSEEMTRMEERSQPREGSENHFKERANAKA